MRSISRSDSRRRFVLRYGRPGYAARRAVLDDVLARATPQFVENEFLEDDSVKFARLARGRSPVDSLGVATGASWPAALATGRSSPRWAWAMS